MAFFAPHQQAIFFETPDRSSFYSHDIAQFLFSGKKKFKDRIFFYQFMNFILCKWFFLRPSLIFLLSFRCVSMWGRGKKKIMFFFGRFFYSCKQKNVNPSLLRILELHKKSHPVVSIRLFPQGRRWIQKKLLEITTWITWSESATATTTTKETTPIKLRSWGLTSHFKGLDLRSFLCFFILAKVKLEK